MTIEQIVILFALPILGGVCFWLGWNAASVRERRAKRILDSNLKLVIKQKQQLYEWVRTNWPTEAAAFKAGHTEGYQQGVLHSPKLEELE